MRLIVFQEGNPHPEVGITFNGQPVGSKEFRRGRNTFTFTGFVICNMYVESKWNETMVYQLL